MGKNTLGAGGCFRTIVMVEESIPICLRKALPRAVQIQLKITLTPEPHNQEE